MKVTAKGGVRVSVAGLVCYRPGHRGRLVYRTLTYRGRKTDPKASAHGNWRPCSMPPTTN